MTVITFICVAILLLLILSLFKKDADIFSPSRVFLFIWALAIGLAEFKFSRYQHQWSAYSWAMLLIALTAFVLGIFVVYVMFFDQKIFDVRRIRFEIVHSEFNDARFYNLIIIIFVAYIVSFSVNAAIKGYIPILTNHPSEMRTDYGIFGIGLIIHASTSILFFIVQYFVLVKNQHAKKAILSVVFLITFATYFSLLQRYDLIFWIIISLTFYYYAKRIRFRTIIPFAGSIVIVIYAIQQIRLSKYFAGYLYVMSKMRFSPKYAILTEPYMYIVMNLENFAHAVTKLKDYTYGYYTFNFVMSLSGLKHWIQKYAYLNDTPFINSGYNTYTMFWAFYRDFGVLGLFLISFTLGLLITSLYYQLRTKPNLHTVSLYALGVFVMVFSFFINPIGQLHFFFNTCMIFGVTYVITKH